MKKNERGFSIIELLVVVAVVGIIASLAVPHLQRALRATENGNMFATLRTIGSTQVNFFSQNNRFARITEINNLLSSSVGTQIGNEVHRGKFVLAMVPASPPPTDLELRTGYTITATRDVEGEGVIYVYSLSQSGEIRQIMP